MANLQNLNIGLGVDPGGLITGLRKAEKSLSSFSSGINNALQLPSSLRNIEGGLKNLDDSILAAVPSGRELGKTMEVIEYQAENLNKDLVNLGNFSDAGLGRLNAGLSKVGTSGVPAANRLSSSLGSMQGSVKGSTMAVVNFNRIIQDAPYGIIGVANNIDPMIQSFNQLRAQTGSTTGALKTLLTSAFTGPGALITVFSLASTAALVFGDRLFGAGKKAKDAEEEVSKLVEAADKLRGVLSQDTGYADEIDRQIDRNKQAIQLAEERERIEAKLSTLVAGRVSGEEFKRIQARREELKREQEAINQVIQALGFEETALKDLEENLVSLRTQQEIYNGTIGTTETRIAAFVDEVEGNAQRAIDNFEAGITGSTDEMEAQRQEVIRLLGTYRRWARDGNENARRAVIVLTEVLGDLNQALGITNEEQQEQLTLVEKSENAIRDMQAGVKGASEELANMENELEAHISDLQTSTSLTREERNELYALVQALRAVREERAKRARPTVTVETPEDETMADPIDDLLPKGDIKLPPPIFPQGSLAQLEQQLSGLREKFRTMAPGTEVFQSTKKQIQETEKAIRQTRNTLADTGAVGTAAFQALGGAMSGVIGKLIQGKKEALSFTNILGSIMPALANLLFPGGGAGMGFLRGLFGGVFHGGGTVPGPMGKEQLVLAQGGETIRTPRQERNIGGNKAVINNYLQVDGRTIYLGSKEYQIGADR